MAILCRNCDEFNTVPGMHWGICDRRARETMDNRIKTILTGPDKVCIAPSKIRDEERKKAELLRSLFPEEEEMSDE